MTTHFRPWSVVKALAYSSFIGASVAELYIQIWIIRIFSPGTVVLAGSGGRSREMTRLEQLLSAIGDMRFSIPPAFIGGAIVLVIMIAAYLQSVRIRSLAGMILMILGGALGGLVGVAIVLMKFGRFTDSTYSVMFAAVAAGAFVATYLRSRIVACE